MNDPFCDLDLGQERIIRVTGHLDSTNSEGFCKNLLRAIDRTDRIVVDLSQTEWIDSSAIASFIIAYRYAESLERELIITSPSDDVIHVLRLSGVARNLGIDLLRDEAVRITGAPQNLHRQDWKITESVILAEPDLLEALVCIAISAAEEAGLDREIFKDVRVAATEAVSNAFIHGSPEPGKSKILLRCLACPKAFVVEVMDEGSGISDDVLPATDKMNDQTGLGLRLIYAAMDEIEFHRDDYGNYIRMLKWLPE